MTMTTNIPGSTKPSGAAEKREAPAMAPNDAHSEAAHSKPGSKPVQTKI